MLLRILRLRSATLRLNKRVQELAAVGTLSLSMTALWGYNIWHIKGEAEAASFKTIVSVLRTSLALNYIQQMLPPPGGAQPASGRPNPFALLQYRPASYVGEVSARQVRQVPPGSWLFDPDCICIGYVPLSSEWLSSPSGERMIWIRIINGQPDQLQLHEHYLWQGKPLD